jgi:integrase
MIISEGIHGDRIQVAPGVVVACTPYGTWQLRFSQHGKRLKKSFPDKDKALRAAQLLAIRAGIDPNKDPAPIWDNFAAMAQKWLDTNQTRWAGNTMERYESMLRLHVVPVIGARTITSIKRAHVKELLADAARIRSPKTVELMHAVLSGVFREAVDLEILADNPATGLLDRILPPRAQRNQTVPDPFTREDLDHFVDASKKVLRSPESLLLELLSCSGMRLGEALAFRPDQLDQHNNQYMVTEAIRRTEYARPKTGRRLLDLPGYMVGRLQAYGGRARLSGDLQLAEHPFHGLHQNAVRRAMAQACRAAKLRTRHPHDLRHTYASLLLMSGVSPAYVQRQLGHSTISMTVDIYGHWIPGVGREHVEDVFGRGTGTGPGVPQKIAL